MLILQSPANCEEFVQPPEFPKEVRDVFFDDARQALSGPPPAHDKLAVSPSEGPLSGQGTDWSSVIDPDTLTTEVKRTANRLTAIVAKPGQFKSADHEVCRRELTMLGSLFLVVGEHPADELRWRSSAASMEQLSFDAAEMCTEGSDESLAAVGEVLARLEELLNGQTVSAKESTVPKLTPEFALLMQRMEYGVKGAIPPLIVREFDFRKQAQAVAHEAGLLTMLSQLIRREEYGYTDDKTYQGHAAKLQSAATQLKEAAAAKDFTKAIEAAAAVTRSCADCHADYRG